MSRALVRGVYGIVVTTWDAEDRVVEADLAAEAAFIAGAAQGVVWPVMASEFHLLRRDEVAAGYAAVARGAGGRVPFVAGVSQLTTPDAVALAEAAREAGADAVIAMPPWMSRVSGGDLVRHFQRITAVGLPIMLQNAGGFSPFSAIAEADLRRLVWEVPEIVALKDEAPAIPQTITRGVRIMPPGRGLVFGGGGGRYLLDELHRGGAGNLPGAAWCDLLGAAYRRWTDGDIEGARSLHVAAQAGYGAVGPYGPAGARWVLHRRGITSSTRGRFDEPAAAALDENAVAELEAVLRHLSPLFPVRAGRLSR